MSDPVKHPNHYTWIPGIECKDITKHFLSMPGSAIKYIWRYQFKGKPVEDLRKAIQCLEYEIERLEHEPTHAGSDKPSQEVDRSQGNSPERLTTDKALAQAMRSFSTSPMVRGVRMVHGPGCCLDLGCEESCEILGWWKEVTRVLEVSGVLDK